MNRKKQRQKNKKQTKRKSAKKAQFLDMRDLPDLRLARALWGKNRYAEALKLFDKTARKHPNHALALIDGARAFGDRYEYHRAEELVKRLVSLADRNGKLQQMAGQTYRMIGRPNEAIECLERALELSPELFEARLELALLYDRFNRLEDAMQHAELCIDLHNSPPEAMYIKGQLLRRMKQQPEAISLLEPLAKNESVHPLVRTKAYFELGYLHDSQEDFDAAYKAVSVGKKLQFAESSHARKEHDRESTGYETLFSELDAPDFERWADALGDVPKEEFVFLTGSPRSGTTLLERVLGSHPQTTSTDEEVALSRYILPNLISYKKKEELCLRNLEAIPKTKILEQRRRYFRYMSHLLRTDVQAGIHIDKNPSLVRLLPAVIRLFPETKILFALRDPRDIAISCYMRYLPINSVSVAYQTLTGTVDSVRTEIQTWLLLKKLIPNEFREIKYEEMVGSFESTTKNAIQFLGLDWSEEVLQYRKSQTMVNSPTYEDVAKPIYDRSVGRWRNYSKHLESHLAKIDKLTNEIGY